MIVTFLFSSTKTSVSQVVFLPLSCVLLISNYNYLGLRRYLKYHINYEVTLLPLPCVPLINKYNYLGQTRYLYNGQRY